MKYILSQAIFIGFVLAIYFAIEMLRKRDMKHAENRLFVQACIFSAIWSFGFFGVIMQAEPDRAYLWRAIGMVGTFGYLITGQFLICHLSDIKSVYRRYAEIFSCLGIFLYFFVIQKSQVTYELSSIGMSYSFHQSIWNKLYIWYSVMVAFNQFALIIYMLRKQSTQRLRMLGRHLVIVEVVMIVGMVLDTIFPLFGMPAVPGSTLGQFVSLAVLYYSISFLNHSRITIDNMSEFIYYSLNVPVLIFDVSERLCILNDTAFSFLGVDKEKMEETTIDMLFALGREKVFSFESNSHSVDTVCLNNEKYCNLAINKIHDKFGDKTGYIIIVTDLSERMKSLLQLEEAMQEAENANRAKSVFLANMSHEIRTPMNAIIGFSELLLNMNISKEVRNYVEDIKWSSRNLLAIINDILDISKIESGKLELVNDEYYVATLLNDVTLIIMSQAERAGLKLNIKIDKTIPKKLYGDRVRIRGVLINILNNAVKYTRKGSVSFEVFTTYKRDDRIKLAFRIQDTGSGIKQEDLESLFDKFERFDRKANQNIEGTGLGLAIAKSYVMLMGGDITVSSQYGRGTIFIVEIEQKILDDTPIEKEDVQGRVLLENKETFAFGVQNVRVLVADDNPINLKVAKGILTTYGIEVDTASSGKEALELCEENNYNMLFVDQMMPEMDGVETMQRIRQISPLYAPGGACPIIVLTANAIKGTRESLMQLGFDEYLGKPLNIERLESVLRRFLPEECIREQKADDVFEETQDDEAYIKSILPQVDARIGMSHCGGDIKDYLEILAITYKYGEKQMEELKTLWEEKDYHVYTIKVHSLKSTALNIGAEELSKEAARQETAGKEGDYDYIENNRERLLTQYAELLEGIREVLAHYDMLPDVQEKENKPELNERMVKHMLQTIQLHIEEFDFAKVFDILEEAKKYELSEKYEEIFAQLEKLMENLEIEAINNLLKENIDR